MNRLVVRLILSHLLVAVVGAVTTFAVVRLLAPQLFDRRMHAMGRGMGRGSLLRDQFASAVDSALIAGVTTGVIGAGLLGAYAAYRLLLPLAALGAAARGLASGRYRQTVPSPGTRELDALAEDIRILAGSLADIETRRTRLLGEVAHEMRTPLTVVEGYAEGMIDGVLPADDVTLGQIGAELTRLRRLADDLSALSRAEEGRLDLITVEADLATLVRSAVERLVPQAEDAGVTLTLASRSPVIADVDAERITQIVTNVVGNALRATPAGGEVAVTVDAVGVTARVTVSDTGEGIATADLDRVFERFYRVPGRRRDERMGEGSGIGLTLSRRFAEAHGGTLTAASAGPGQGARFTLLLPAHGT